MPITGDWLARAARLPRSTQIAAGVGVLVIAIAASWFAVGARGCSSRSDVEARVAVASAALQQAAAQGKIKIEALAAGIRRLNESATAYNASHDHKTYCDALEQLRGEYKLDE